MSPLAFEIAGAKPHLTSAAPAVILTLRAKTDAACRVDLLALHAQIMIHPRRRHYATNEEAALVDLFGRREQWGESLHPLLWTHVDAVVPGFTGETEIELNVPCSYDFEVASNKYLDALAEGDIPLLLLFSGTAFVAGDRGLSVSRIPWNLEAPYRLPVATYRAAIAARFPNVAWIRVRKDVFEELNRFKSAGCFASWERAFEAMLDAVKERR